MFDQTVLMLPNWVTHFTPLYPAPTITINIFPSHFSDLWCHQGGEQETSRVRASISLGDGAKKRVAQSTRYAERYIDSVNDWLSALILMILNIGWSSWTVYLSMIVLFIIRALFDAFFKTLICILLLTSITLRDWVKEQKHAETCLLPPRW